MNRYAQVGLAFATSIGAWVNLAAADLVRARAGLFTFEPELVRSAVRLAAAGAGAGGRAVACRRAGAVAVGGAAALRDEAALALLAVIGAVVYGAMVLALFGRRWFAVASVTGSVAGAESTTDQ